MKYALLYIIKTSKNSLLKKVVFLVIFIYSFIQSQKNLNFIYIISTRIFRLKESI